MLDEGVVKKTYVDCSADIGTSRRYSLLTAFPCHTVGCTDLSGHCHRLCGHHSDCGCTDNVPRLLHWYSQYCLKGTDQPRSGCLIGRHQCWSLTISSREDIGCGLSSRLYTLCPWTTVLQKYEPFNYYETRVHTLHRNIQKHSQTLTDMDIMKELLIPTWNIPVFPIFILTDI